MVKNRLSFLATLVTISAVIVMLVAGCGRDRLPEGAIRVVVFDRGSDGGRTNPANNKWTQWIQKKVKEELGFEVIFEPVSRWDEAQAQVTIMAAGNPPDLMMSWSFDNVTAWGEQGGLFDMAPYVDTHLHETRNFLGPDSGVPGRDFILRNMNNLTGQMFSVPMKYAYAASRNVFMRQDWLDALGLPVPTTHEEFFNALVAFRDRNPGGVDRVVPWTMTRDVRWMASHIMDSFIDPNLSIRDRWVNTVVDRNFLLPNYKEGVRFMNRMWNAGLIDEDFFLYGNDTPMNNLISSGAVGAFGHNWDQIFRESEGLTTNLRMIVPGAEWVPVDAFPSSDGVTHKSHSDGGLFVFIPKTARNPENAMRYLNWISKFENMNFLQIGPEGIVHEMVDGLPVINPNAGDGWIQNSGLNIDLAIIANGLFLKTEEDSVRALALTYNPFPAEEVMRAYNVSSSNSRVFPVITTAGPLLAAGPVALTLQQQAEALLINAIMAPEAEFDDVWDSGIQTWLNSGARDIVEERAANFVPPY